MVCRVLVHFTTTSKPGGEGMMSPRAVCLVQSYLETAAGATLDCLNIPKYMRVKAAFKQGPSGPALSHSRHNLVSSCGDMGSIWQGGVLMDSEVARSRQVIGYESSEVAERPLAL